MPAYLFWAFRRRLLAFRDGVYSMLGSCIINAIGLARHTAWRLLAYRSRDRASAWTFRRNANYANDNPKEQRIDRHSNERRDFEDHSAGGWRRSQSRERRKE